MSKTQVVNKYHNVPFDIYIGRGTMWGNPFVIGKHGTREEVIAMYREWILSEPTMLAELPKLRGKTLGCFCKPLPCHGDILVELAEDYIDI